MSKCDKAIDEFCDRTSDLEDTVQVLRDLTAEVVKRHQQMTEQKPMPIPVTVPIRP